MGQHPGIVQIKLHVSGWVNITGMVGQHETEWWVNMVRNLQLSPKAFADNPILSKYLSSTSPLFSGIWLTSIMFTIQLWYILNRKEQRELRLKSNLNLENTQNQIFHKFIDWKVRSSEIPIQTISFTKAELIDFITNLRVNRNEIRHEAGLSERKERLQNNPFLLLTNNVSIDFELAQGLTDLIVARAEKKGVIELEKSKSLTDKYKFIVSEEPQ